MGEMTEPSKGFVMPAKRDDWDGREKMKCKICGCEVESNSDLSEKNMMERHMRARNVSKSARITKKRLSVSRVQLQRYIKKRAKEGGANAENVRKPRKARRIGNFVYKGYLNKSPKNRLRVGGRS